MEVLGKIRSDAQAQRQGVPMARGTRRRVVGSRLGRSRCDRPVAVARGGFTLIEMLTTVAALIIVMGLAVSLAREVRRRSADVVTRDVLGQLDRMMDAYLARYGHPPPVPALIDLPPTTGVGDPASPTPAPDPVALARSARRNNQAVVAAMQQSAGLGFADELFGKLPRSMYDDITLRDAWGSPVVFMTAMHPAIGMAQDNRPFFFSAGPDGDYLTRDDNLYSYEGR